jgi:hypothetical protein
MDEAYTRVVAAQFPAVESVSIYSLIAETDPEDDDEEEDEEEDYWRSDLPPVIWARDAVDLIDAGEYPAFPCGAD